MTGLVPVVLAGVAAVGALANPAGAQPQATTPPTVEIVSTVGCAVKDPGAPPTWRLTRAASPVSTPEPFASQESVAQARIEPLGALSFSLVGVAEYLTDEDRAELTLTGNEVVGFQKASTGQLQNGHQVAVRGLLVDVDGVPTINLTSVVSLQEQCG